MTLPSASTRLIALLGDPVEHSLSPAFQNAALRATGLDAVYVALRCDAASLAGLLRGIARAGGAGNVTVPHKEAAARLVERRTEAVELTGACNTFWSDGEEIWGDNTDVAGFRAAVHSLLGAPPAGARVVVIGAGGAARAAVAGLAADGAGEILLFNRTPERAIDLARGFGRLGTSVQVLQSAGATGADLVVNATSLGLRPGDPMPLDESSASRCSAALDLVYAPGGTPWVRLLRERGIPAADGREMLLQQGAAAFQRWWGTPAPLAVMRSALSGG